MSSFCLLRLLMLLKAWGTHRIVQYFGWVRLDEPFYYLRTGIYYSATLPLLEIVSHGTFKCSCWVMFKPYICFGSSNHSLTSWVTAVWAPVATCYFSFAFGWISVLWYVHSRHDSCELFVYHFWAQCGVSLAEAILPPSDEVVLREFDGNFWQRLCTRCFKNLPHPHGHWHFQALLGNLSFHKEAPGQLYLL